MGCETDWDRTRLVGRGYGFGFGISHIDPEALQDHCEILYSNVENLRVERETYSGGKKKILKNNLYAFYCTTLYMLNNTIYIHISYITNLKYSVRHCILLFFFVDGGGEKGGG